MSVTDVLYYFDESGDFGYLDKEPPAGSFGVVAGFAFPASHGDEYSRILNELYLTLETTGCDKIRSAFVFVGNRNKEIFDKYLDFFLDNQLLIIYEAICLRGAYKNKMELDDIIKRNTTTTKENNIITITKDEQDNMYHDVLKGIIIKLDTMCSLEGNNSLSMVSDNIDKKILKISKRNLNDLSKKDYNRSYKMFDKSKRQNFTSKITIRTDFPDMDVKYVKEIGITTDNGPAFAADFVSNSIYRHLKEKIKTGHANKLHAKEIMEGYPLIKKIVFLNDEDMTDKIYNHLC